MIDFGKIVQKFSPQNGFHNFVFEKINNYDRIIIPKYKLIEVCEILKDEFEFDQLIDLVGVDRFTKNDRFEVLYNLWSNEHKFRIFLRVKLDTKKTEVESVTKVWSTANWEEREAYDMYGIIFINHPDLRRIYMMDEYEFYPLRKDYPLMGLPGAVELPKK
jgi:NADH-quinone oxidoreductase subunit C